MKGDFSRSTFDPKNHYTSVRMQQGRMQLDADWNEQMDILLYLMRAQVQDLLGPYGAPAASAGFEIKRTNEGQADLIIKKGRYYVDGILVENESDTLFSTQPYRPNARLPEAANNGDRYVVYLDVWERDLNGIEAPSILEPALNGLDTTTRTQTVWEVKLRPEPSGPAEDQPATDDDLLKAWHDWRDQETLPASSGGRGMLQPKVKTSDYGLANQLYRVEIHSAGDETTFKWSRDNGSVAFAVSKLDEKNGLLTVTLEGLHAETQLKAGDWVELVDASFELGTRPAPLFQLSDPPSSNPPSLTFKLPNDSALSQQELQAIQANAARVRNAQSDTNLPRTLLRRWDYHEYAPGVAMGKDNAMQVQDGQWQPLENGIEVRFEDTGRLRAGDYWLIPARSEADGYTLLWKTQPQPASPSDNDKTGAQPSPAGDETTVKPIFAALSARRVDHHYAPLAVLSHDGTQWKISDRRTLFRSIAHWEAEETDTESGLKKSIDELRTDLSQQAATTLAAMHALRDEMLSSVTYRLSDPGGSLTPGQVVALDPVTGGIQLATRDNATLVVGVTLGPVVDRTGNQPETRSYLVAQYGHQDCLVVGRVEPGDMLVPSDTPGCATSAGIYVRPGTLIGKALQGHRPADASPCAPIAIMVTLR